VPKTEPRKTAERVDDPEGKKPQKITETLRDAVLRRPFEPSVTRDNDVRGLALHVTTRRSFWALSYQPRGVNPTTGKRWGGGVRHELGDAMIMTVDQARTAAMKAKARVREGISPHHASAVAARAVLPQTTAESLDSYAKALAVRTTPSARTRAQSVHYARLACTLMNALALPLASVNASMIRLLVETAPGADAQRRHIYGGLSRFLSWARKQRLLETNPCDTLDKSDRPKPGHARDHVPTLKTLRAIWAAVEDEQACDLIRFMLLVPLRRNEASGLRWREVDFDQNRIRIPAHRMKAREAHELPLSAQARAILEARKAQAAGDFVFPNSKGAPRTNWTQLLARIRKRIDEGNAGRAERFSLHDLRRSFVSLLAEDFDVDALDQVLAHKRSGVAAIYQRSKRWPERVRALDAWAALVTGEAVSDEAIPANVLPFARRADV
jgi:integrase